MVPTIRILPVHKLASLPAGEALTWQLAFKVLSFSRLSIQASVLLPAHVAVLPGAASYLHKCDVRSTVVTGLLC